jgi:ABC-type multidrug transport system ATPase subunit
MTPGIVRDGRDTNTQMVKVFGCRQAYESGMTMLVVSHEMQFVHDVASRVVFMDGGQIVEQGRPREIFRDRPKSERLAAAAKRFFKRLLQGLRYKPRRIITDGLLSYGVAQRAILPDVRHRRAGISTTVQKTPALCSSRHHTEMVAGAVLFYDIGDGKTKHSCRPD